ncbi:MAG: tyrosine-protein phosphatase [Chloroflexota bacterium]
MAILQFEGSYNSRDLGGLPTNDGKVTQSKVLIRSGNLDKLTQAGQQSVLGYGIQTIIDLRNEWEMEYYPNVFAESDKLTYLPLPLIGDNLSHDTEWQKHTRDYVELHELYIKYLDGCQAQIGQIVSAIVEQNSPVIIHCHAGKDRTGIISALVLGAVGATDEAIAKDYALTKKYIQHLIVEWRDYAIENDRDLEQFERDNATNPKTIYEMFRHIRTSYGSIKDYLKQCGLSDKQLSRLREKLIRT